MHLDMTNKLRSVRQTLTHMKSSRSLSKTLEHHLFDGLARVEELGGVKNMNNRKTVAVSTSQRYSTTVVVLSELTSAMQETDRSAIITR